MTVEARQPGIRGFQFQRVDLPGQPVIKADCDLVTGYLAGNDVGGQRRYKISTVEHILAAPGWNGVSTTAWSKVNGPEIPVLSTGVRSRSSKIIEEARSAGAGCYKKPGIASMPTSRTMMKRERVEMVVMPSMEYKVTTLVDFNSPVLGTQHAGPED